MQYLIAGGGDFGTRYLRKLNIARKRGNFPVESVTIFDNNPNCKARKFVEKIPYARLEIADLLEFGELVWKRKDEWKGATWVPAPVAPHLISGWITTKIQNELGIRLLPVLLPLNSPKLPFLKLLPDGRVLLSHAPGICPVNCTEPANCAITNRPRWWEMKDTIAEMLADLPEQESVSHTSIFYGEHHYAADGYAVGGIPMDRIYTECERLTAIAKKGVGRIGIATISSCHGVLNLFDVTGATAGMRSDPEPNNRNTQIRIQLKVLKDVSRA